MKKFQNPTPSLKSKQTMTPEEKANQLIEKFEEPTQQWDEVTGEWKDDIDNAKQCAIIAVDEILEEYGDQQQYLNGYEKDRKEYWQQVKTILTQTP